MQGWAHGNEKFGINFHLRRKLFLIVNFHFSLAKAAMNTSHLCKLRKDYLTGIGNSARVLTKRLHFFIFPLPKAEQRPLRTCQL
jgi:hypothetical protein